MNLAYKRAFPRPASVDESGDLPQCMREQDGMTLREHYAGLAMQGILAADAIVLDVESHARNDPADVAVWAVRHADALIKELGK